MSGARESSKSTTQLAELGFNTQQLAAPHATSYSVWPDNWQPLMIFEQLLSQLNVGPGGVVGLRYEALPFVLRMNQVPRAQQPALFDDLRQMERHFVTLAHDKTP